MPAKPRPTAPAIHSSARRDTTKSLQRTSPRSSLKRIAPFLALIAVITLGFFLFKHVHHSQDLNNLNVIKAKISKHYLLPTNETPALATVTDSKKVQASLIGKVKDNDKILIYEKSQKAIVYRPSLDRIVDVEIVTISKSTDSTSATSTTIPNINPFGN